MRRFPLSANVTHLVVAYPYRFVRPWAASTCFVPLFFEPSAVHRVLCCITEPHHVVIRPVHGGELAAIFVAVSALQMVALTDWRFPPENKTWFRCALSFAGLKD